MISVFDTHFEKIMYNIKKKMKSVEMNYLKILDQLCKKKFTDIGILKD